jgi:hypothetical protein
MSTEAPRDSDGTDRVAIANPTPKPKRTPWRVSKGWEVVLGFAVVLSGYAMFLLGQDSYICHGEPLIGFAALTWLLCPPIAIWSLWRHDYAAFAWLAAWVAATFLILAMADVSFCITDS